MTISVEGVAVQEAKGKTILHQFPLHQISYCADDKDEKKFFSFIAKDGEIHRCFVFVSEKLVIRIIGLVLRYDDLNSFLVEPVEALYSKLNVLFLN